MTHFDAVKEFMTVMGQTVLTEPKLPTMKLALLRYKLIEEEVNELEEALQNDDHVEIADALSDILYVGYGAYAAFGIEPGDMEYNDGPWDNADVLLPSVGEARDFLTAMRSCLEQLDYGYTHDNMTIIQNSITTLLDQAYLLAFEMGIDIYSCFTEVHSSNMSKVCKTLADAEHSLFERQQHPETFTTYADAVVVQSGEYYVLRKANGKILKGLDYFEPNLRQYMNF